MKHFGQEFLYLHVAQAAFAVVRFKLVEIAVFGQKFGKVFGLRECVEVGKNGIAFHFTGVFHADVVGVGEHAHYLFVNFFGAVGKIDAVAQRFTHFCLAVDTGKTSAIGIFGQNHFGFDKSFAVYRVEFMHDFAALFKHGSLIFAYRHGGGFKRRYVRRLAYRIAQKSDGNAVFKVAHLDFRFDRRVALKPRQRYEVHVVER